MVFKRFRVQIVLRVILIAITVFLVFLLHKETAYAVSTIILSLLLIVQIISLIRYTEQTNKKLQRFFESIRYADFTSSFTENELGKSFEGLYNEFNQVIEAFNKNKTEKEEHFNYLLTVIQHVSIGIIVFKKSGEVDVYNNAVKRLLQIKHLRMIEHLKEISEELPEILMHMKAGEKSLVKLFIDDEMLQISISTTSFRMRREEYMLTSFQDIHPELEQKEIESWQKLIRVLTHEIMNSITPISSLASTVKGLIGEFSDTTRELTNDEKENFDSIVHAISTIESRSKGLLNFVDLYRNLTRIPKPKFRYFPVNTLFDRAFELMSPKFEILNIEYKVRIYPHDLKILADPDLIDQVLINLILNAIDAVKEVLEPKINVIASVNLNNRTMIEVSDNGKGISQDILDKIFMPFFTSKKSGSGIGLSLSRQIMQMHKGTISVRSKYGEGATFIMVF
jgi:nitrogen fixation/metabolism regulation signal transduction histidine kinase